MPQRWHSNGTAFSQEKMCYHVSAIIVSDSCHLPGLCLQMHAPDLNHAGSPPAGPRRLQRRECASPRGGGHAAYWAATARGAASSATLGEEMKRVGNMSNAGAHQCGTSGLLPMQESSGCSLLSCTLLSCTLLSCCFPSALAMIRHPRHFSLVPPLLNTQQPGTLQRPGCSWRIGFVHRVLG